MVFERVKKVIVNQLGIEESEVEYNTSFDELGVDSLDLFQIVIELEEEFNVRIEETDDIKSVEDAVKYIEAKL